MATEATVDRTVDVHGFLSFSRGDMVVSEWLCFRVGVGLFAGVERRRVRGRVERSWSR